MDKRPNHRDISYHNNVGSFVDVEMLAQLGPSLDKHYIGGPKPTQKRVISNKSVGKLQNKNNTNTPPPLPEASSTSDIYTKKIASFKRKLKTLKGISTDSKSKSILPELSLDKTIQKPPQIVPNDITERRKYRAHSNKSTDFNNISNNSNPFYETSSPTISSFNTSGNDMNVPARKFAKENKCSICNLLLDTSYNIQDDERIIELQCNHMVHEECLVMDLELNIMLSNVALTDKSVIIKYLPPCTLCTNNKTIPKSDEVVTDIFTKMITTHLTNPNMTVNSSTLSIPSPSTPTYYENPKFMSTNSLPYTPPNHDSSVSIITHDLQRILGPTEIDRVTIKDKNEYEFGEPANLDNQMPKRSSPYKKHSKRPSRGSYASATSAIVTSVSQNRNSVADFDNLSNKSLGQKFVNELLILATQRTITGNDDANFILSEEFVRSLGNLKLIDKLTFVDSRRNDTLNDCYCYLFDHMLLTFTLTEMKFYLISINRLTNIETAEGNIIVVKTNRNTNFNYKLIFESTSLRDKWKMIMGTSHYDKTTPITTTLSNTEFDHLIVNDNDDLETIGTLQSYIGEDGYRRLPTGVCPRFYEGTINSIIFKEKPTRTIIVLNQTNYIPQSTVSVKNMVASLSLIGIDILLILVSTPSFSMDSNIIDSYESSQVNQKKDCENMLNKIDEFQDYLQFNSNSQNNKTVSTLIGDYVSHTGIYDSIVSMVISNTSLKDVENDLMLNQILIEVGLDSQNRSNRSDVNDLASWEEIMEVVCGHCGLEFDESDFYVSSDDETDSDDDDCNNKDGVHGDSDSGSDKDDVLSQHIPLRMRFGLKQH